MVDRSQKEFTVRGGHGPGEIGDLDAKFLIPGAGSFGRDKTVTVDEATAAKASYVRDGQRVVDQSLSVPEAVALVEKAVVDGQAADQRHAAAQAQQQVELDEARRKVANLACTVCGYQHFDEQTSREDSQMGFTTFRMRLASAAASSCSSPSVRASSSRVRSSPRLDCGTLAARNANENGASRAAIAARKRCG